ncbi:MAG: methyltransferase domain-containing protein [Flavobacteriaceae bacterium]|nr:methyltransferase domain-containing protein [Flavobacteriaceae bacterium]
MRIIGGTKKGIRLSPPKGLPVRPTTDMAKESLFNILTHRMNFEGLKVLDLFAGTGNLSFEFASRGVVKVISIDSHIKCVQYLKKIALEQGFKKMLAHKEDVFAYLKNWESDDSFDLVFADPPYAMNGLGTLPDLILEKNILREAGTLIVEHSSKFSFKDHKAFAEQRVYGQSCFSFFVKS